MANITTTLVLAMSADGKITSVDPKAPGEIDPVDFAHYEYQSSLADLALVGGKTIRIQGETFLIQNPELLAARKFRQQSTQPITCVVSRAFDISPDIHFFTQDVERWIFTTEQGLKQNPHTDILREKANVIALGDTEIDWDKAYEFMEERGIGKVVAWGGGGLAASLIKVGKIDDWWLTVWPFIFGGKDVSTPVEGEGYLPLEVPRMELIETRQVGSDIFLHYRMLK